MDTAKHVELAAWQQLKDLKRPGAGRLEWANPDKKLDNAPFWMTGESWGHGVMQSDYYRHGFDAMINFDYQEQAAKRWVVWPIWISPGSRWRKSRSSTC